MNRNSGRTNWVEHLEVLLLLLLLLCAAYAVDYCIFFALYLIADIAIVGFLYCSCVGLRKV